MKLSRYLGRLTDDKATADSTGFWPPGSPTQRDAMILEITVPQPDSRSAAVATIGLADGRTIGCAEYGDPVA
jgi:hypothetical protein